MVLLHHEFLGVGAFGGGEGDEVEACGEGGEVNLEVGVGVGETEHLSAACIGKGEGAVARGDRGKEGHGDLVFRGIGGEHELGGFLHLRGYAHTSVAVEDEIDGFAPGAPYRGVVYGALVRALCADVGGVSDSRLKPRADIGRVLVGVGEVVAVGAVLCGAHRYLVVRLQEGAVPVEPHRVVVAPAQAEVFDGGAGEGVFGHDTHTVGHRVLPHGVAVGAHIDVVQHPRKEAAEAVVGVVDVVDMGARAEHEPRRAVFDTVA